MAADGYAWWRRRIARQRELFDLVRIDHFRGFEAAWHVPVDAPTARDGWWVPGPGDELLAALVETAGPGTLIAEDLGQITPGVEQLLDRFLGRVDARALRALLVDAELAQTLEQFGDAARLAEKTRLGVFERCRLLRIGEGRTRIGDQLVDGIHGKKNGAGRLGPPRGSERHALGRADIRRRGWI